MNEEGDVQFVDAEQYSGKADEKLTFRMICLEHLRRIGKLASVEFRGGYYDVRTIHMPSVTNYVKVYVPDSREEYSNAVDYLADILCPYFDEEVTKIEQDCDAELAKVYENSFVEDEDNNGKKELDRQFYRQEKVKIKRKLFRALNKFLQRIKYLEGKTFEEEA